MNLTQVIIGLKHYWLSLAFVAGFITDVLLLNQVDDLFDNAVLLFYVVLATLSLILLYIGIAERAPEKLSRLLRAYAPIAMQYAFGGLLSGMLIFYGRSGDLFASWPFLLIIIAAIAGNELLRNRSQRLVFNLAVYFVGLFSYLVLVIAVFSGRTEPWVFFGSGFLALALVYGLIRLLALIIPQYMRLQMRAIVFTVGCLFVLLNGLYITSVLPPIPLSLKEIIIAQSVVRFESTGEYEVRYVPVAWWNVFDRLNLTFHPSPGGGVACFARVFAPVSLETTIEHVWQYKDEATGEWRESFRLGYPITGTAEDGYRGYTAIQNYRDGQWRCVVQTTRGQVLGRQTFTIDSSVPPTGVVNRVE